jgi:hypothetical protein
MIRVLSLRYDSASETEQAKITEKIKELESSLDALGSKSETHKVTVEQVKKILAQQSPQKKKAVVFNAVVASLQEDIDTEILSDKTANLFSDVVNSAKKPGVLKGQVTRMAKKHDINSVDARVLMHMAFDSLNQPQLTFKDGIVIRNEEYREIADALATGNKEELLKIQEAFIGNNIIKSATRIEDGIIEADIAKDIANIGKGTEAGVVEPDTSKKSKGKIEDESTQASDIIDNEDFGINEFDTFSSNNVTNFLKDKDITKLNKEELKELSDIMLTDTEVSYLDSFVDFLDSYGVKKLTELEGDTNALLDLKNLLTESNTINEEIIQNENEVYFDDLDTRLSISGDPVTNEGMYNSKSTTLDIETAVEDLFGQDILKNKHIVVVQNQDNLPANLKKEFGNLLNNTRGIYSDKTVYLIADHIKPEDIYEVLKHEILHYLIHNDTKFKAVYNKMLQEFKNNDSKEAKLIKLKAKQAVNTLNIKGKEAREAIELEEGLARYIQYIKNKESKNIFTKLKIAFKAFLVRLGVTGKFTELSDQDIQNIIIGRFRNLTSQAKQDANSRNLSYAEKLHATWLSKLRKSVQSLPNKKLKVKDWVDTITETVQEGNKKGPKTYISKDSLVEIFAQFPNDNKTITKEEVLKIIDTTLYDSLSNNAFVFQTITNKFPVRADQLSNEDFNKLMKFIDSLSTDKTMFSMVDTMTEIKDQIIDNVVTITKNKDIGKIIDEPFTKLDKFRLPVVLKEKFPNQLKHALLLPCRELETHSF